MTTEADPAIDGADLTAFVIGKLCHDLVSPAGAISSGLDLLDDPSTQDMREMTMELIAASSVKLRALLEFARVAYGAATADEAFDGDRLRGLVEGVFRDIRAELDWRAAERVFTKPQARMLLNLAQLTGAALPGGGTAVVEAREEGGLLVLEGRAEGPRARLRPEAVEGLCGRRHTEGMAGQWIQSYWLFRAVADEGGTLVFEPGEDRVTIRARTPAA